MRAPAPAAGVVAAPVATLPAVRPDLTSPDARPAGPNEDENPGEAVSVANIVEISATSTQSFEDAVQQGVARATKTLRQVTSAWIKEQRVELNNGRIASYQVNMLVTFVLEDTLDGDQEMGITEE